MRVTIFILSLMTVTFLSDLLGKHIDVLPNAIISHRLKDLNIYNTKGFNGELFGKKFDHIVVTTDKSDTILKTAIYFPEIIDSLYYDQLVLNYGNPESILKNDVLLKNEEFDHESYNLSNSIYSLTETNFNDQPVYIFWNKERFQIKVYLNYDNKMTRIVFIKPKVD